MRAVRITFAVVLASGLSACFRPDIRTVEIAVPGMTTQEDAEGVLSMLNLYRQVGVVHDAEADLERRCVRVTYDSTLTALRNLDFIIAAGGYDAGTTPARRRRDPQADTAQESAYE